MKTTAALWAAAAHATPGRWIDASEWTAADCFALDDLFAAHPPAPYDVALIEPGEKPRMMTRTELDDHLAACGCSRASKALRRTWAPPRHGLVMAISDRGVGFKFWNLEHPQGLPRTTEPTPAVCAAMRVSS